MSANALRSTVLADAHRALGARMVDFAGWEMPLHYGSQIEEHRAVRSAAGVFDVSHMLALDVEGGGAQAFLRRLLSNDVAKLKTPGQALYSCLLDGAGGILDDLIAYWRGGSRFRLVLNAGTAEKDCAWIVSQREDASVRIEPRRDLAILAVQGPRAREKTWEVLPRARAATESIGYFHSAEVAGMRIARTGYTGEDGFEIMLPAEAAAGAWSSFLKAGVAPAGLGARDTLRLEAGMNLYGQDMDETVTPLECGLAWTVALAEPRAFIGREAVEGKAVMRERRGLVLIDKGVMRSHQKVRCAAGDGEITSGGFSPTLTRSIALARLPSAAAGAEEAEVEVRGNWLRAKVVEPPFVRRGKVLVNL
jgi:aminomethyltransferase